MTVSLFTFFNNPNVQRNPDGSIVINAQQLDWNFSQIAQQPGVPGPQGQTGAAGPTGASSAFPAGPAFGLTANGQTGITLTPSVSWADFSPAALTFTQQPNSGSAITYSANSLSFTGPASGTSPNGGFVASTLPANTLGTTFDIYFAFNGVTYNATSGATPTIFGGNSDAWRLMWNGTNQFYFVDQAGSSFLGAWTATGYTAGTVGLFMLRVVAGSPSTVHLFYYTGGAWTDLGSRTAVTNNIGGDGYFTIHSADINGTDSGGTVAFSAIAAFPRSTVSADMTLMAAWLAAPSVPPPYFGSFAGSVALQPQIQAPNFDRFDYNGLAANTNIAPGMLTVGPNHPFLMSAPRTSYLSRGILIPALGEINFAQSLVQNDTGATFNDDDFLVALNSNPSGSAGSVLQDTDQLLIRNLRCRGSGLTLATLTTPAKRIAGLHTGVFNPAGSLGSWGTPAYQQARLRIENFGANNLPIGLLSWMTQYWSGDTLRIGGCDLGLMTMTNPSGGGNIDWGLLNFWGFSANIAHIAHLDTSTVTEQGMGDARIEKFYFNTTGGCGVYAARWNWSTNPGGYSLLLRDGGSEFQNGDNSFLDIPAPSFRAKDYGGVSDPITFPVYCAVAMALSMQIEVERWTVYDKNAWCGIWRSAHTGSIKSTNSGGGGRIQGVPIHRGDDITTSVKYFFEERTPAGYSNNTYRWPDDPTIFDQQGPYHHKIFSGVGRITRKSRLRAAVSSVQAGGSGYAVGDIVAVPSGDYESALIARVATVSTGAIQTVTVLDGGCYSMLPANPAAVVGGTGSGATLNLSQTAIFPGMQSDLYSGADPTQPNIYALNSAPLSAKGTATVTGPDGKQWTVSKYTITGGSASTGNGTILYTIPFTGGSGTALAVGHHIYQLNSNAGIGYNATAQINAITITSGSFAGSNAAGTLEVNLLDNGQQAGFAQTGVGTNGLGKSIEGASFSISAAPTSNATPMFYKLDWFAGGASPAGGFTPYAGNPPHDGGIWLMYNKASSPPATLRMFYNFMDGASSPAPWAYAAGLWQDLTAATWCRFSVTRAQVARDISMAFSFGNSCPAIDIYATGLSYQNSVSIQAMQECFAEGVC